MGKSVDHDLTVHGKIPRQFIGLNVKIILNGETFKR